MLISKITAFFLVVSFISLYLVNFNISALAQVETTIDSTASSEAVTSVNDAILKSGVIISQVAILGIIFNYFFFSRFFNKKRDNILYEPKKNNIYFNIKTLKRVTSIVILCCISIVIFSTCSMLLQSSQLAQNLDLDIYSAFDILYSTSVGQVWLLRVVTSSAIIGIMLISYVISRTRKKANLRNSENLNKSALNKKHFSNNMANQLFLLVVIVLSSINLFSNSMVSHSNSLSSFSTFAVSMDWIHFMAVSIWIGGLFYLSLILVKNLKPIDYDDKSNSTNTVSDASNNIMSVYNISIALMNFSFIVIIALCIIGISGIYLGYVHLQDLNSVFSTPYGQILILKLGLAFPLIFIGRYNQLKIYNYTALTSNLLKDIGNNTNDRLPQQYREKSITLFKALNKSLKIESLLSTSVLIVASFLSVTSPPSLEAMSQDSFTMQDNNNISKSNNSFFFYLVVALAVVISAIGIVNFRKNQKQIKTISALTK